MNDNFLNFKKVSEQETELYVYGDIRKKDFFDSWFGTGKDVMNATTLKDALALVDTPELTVRINSYGGSVAEGLAIYGQLSSFKGKVRTIVDGFACSAASIIFMAGQERIVPENGLLMIHNAWGRMEGDSNAMKKFSEDLEKITQPSLDIYVLKTGLAEEKIKEMMDKETWITSKEAYEMGFSTSIIRNEPKQALEADFVYKLVMNTKEKEFENQKIKEEYEAKIENLEKEVEQKNQEIEQKIKEFENKSQIEQNKTKIEDSWKSFFNVKK